MKMIGIEDFSLKNLIYSTNSTAFRSTLSRIMDFAAFELSLSPYIEEKKVIFVCFYLLF